jgi:DNA polymerase I
MASDLIGMSFSWKAGTGWYVPVRGPAGSTHLEPRRAWMPCGRFWKNEAVKKVGHNLKYDLLVMRQAGVNVRGVEVDSMIAAFLLDPSRMQYGIDRLALDMLNFRKVPTSDLIGRANPRFPWKRWI